MFCGSCMHDNTLARAILAGGDDALLVPCYSPIRVDEDNVSQRRVFLGGLNLFLDHKLPLWRRVPAALRRPLDHPAVLKLLTRLSGSSDAAQLGDLTLDLLRGEHGPLATELPPLLDYLVDELRPDAVLFSNALLGGILPSLRARYDGPIACLLQGDDIFLDGLPERHRLAAIDAVGELAGQFDRFLTHSRFYAAYMAGYLDLPASRFATIPLGIDAESFGPAATPPPPTIGYFARRAPEKGLHHFVDAALALATRRPGPQPRLLLGGYTHPKDATYAARQLVRLQEAGFDLVDVGSPDTHDEKVAALRQCTIFSVPTDFLEPKGLPVLEAMACGVPCVQPEHGAFPELLQTTGGGRLVPPHEPEALAEAWGDLLDEEPERRRLAERALSGVQEHYGMPALAQRTLATFAELRASSTDADETRV